MTPTERDKRIAEISDVYVRSWFRKAVTWNDIVIRAINASISDPILTADIRNSALEDAASKCEEYLLKDHGEEPQYAPEVECAFAIRSLKEK